jgi:hypothetical protein
MSHQIVVFENVIGGALRARCSGCDWAFEDLSGQRYFENMWRLFVAHVDELRARSLLKVDLPFGARMRPKSGHRWRDYWDHRPKYEELAMYTEFGVDCLHYSVQFAGRGRNSESHWLYRIAVRREQVQEAGRVMIQEHRPWLERTFPTGPKFADLVVGTAAFAAARGRE